MHMIEPYPNLNGSSPERLSDLLADVCHAIIALKDAMAQATPHGRDYQTGGDYIADRREHLRRWDVIDELLRQYQDEMFAIHDKAVG